MVNLLCTWANPPGIIITKERKEQNMGITIDFLLIISRYFIKPEFITQL
jgi:hypothetical protein